MTNAPITPRSVVSYRHVGRREFDHPGRRGGKPFTVTVSTVMYAARDEDGWIGETAVFVTDLGVKQRRHVGRLAALIRHRDTRTNLELHFGRRWTKRLLTEHAAIVKRATRHAAPREAIVPCPGGCGREFFVTRNDDAPIPNPPSSVYHDDDEGRSTMECRCGAELDARELLCLAARLAADAERETDDGPCPCSGTDYHLPSCGGTCG